MSTETKRLIKIGALVVLGALIAYLLLQLIAQNTIATL